MFIQTEDTPNPATMKFLPGQEVLGARSPVDFPDVSGAARSPLAQALFGVEGVKGVFLGRDFVTVTKDDRKDWPVLKPALLSAIMEHFVTGRATLREGDAADDAATGTGGEDTAVIRQIREILDLKIRPAVAQDGGDITFHRFEDGVVYLQLKGSCAGCPSSTATLKSGVENMLKHYIPEVREVRQMR